TIEKTQSNQQQLEEAELIREISAETFSKRVLSYYRNVITNDVFETEKKKTTILMRKIKQINR
ncbi:hypothetical protein, partial [Jeotgalibaca porci]